MINLQSISQALSEAFARQMTLSKDQQEVIAYGIFGLLHTLLTIGFTLITAYFLDLLLPVSIMLIASSLLRSFAGGAHCSSPMRCTIAGTTIFIIFGFLVKVSFRAITIPLYYLYIVSGFVSSIATIRYYCPVDSPNKPIKRIETKNRLRKGANLVMLFLFLVILLFELYSYNTSSMIPQLINFSIITGLLWQSITMLPIGHRFITRIDHVLSYITK